MSFILDRGFAWIEHKCRLSTETRKSYFAWKVGTWDISEILNWCLHANSNIAELSLSLRHVAEPVVDVPIWRYFLIQDIFQHIGAFSEIQTPCPPLDDDACMAHVMAIAFVVHFPWQGGSVSKALELLKTPINFPLIRFLFQLWSG